MFGIICFINWYECNFMIGITSARCLPHTFARACHQQAGKMHYRREITQRDFDECFPVIKEVLEKSEFIAFDAEFTGISSNNKEKNSLFDTPAERYVTVKENIEKFIICQFGLTAFKLNHNDNKYMATSFVFYVFPRPIGHQERTFVVESSAFEFLSKHDFDFTKLVQNGIGYISIKESKHLDELLQDGRTSQLNERLKLTEYKLKNGPLLSSSYSINSSEEAAIIAELARIEQWLAVEREETDFLEAQVISNKEEVKETLIESIELRFPTAIQIELLENNEMIYLYRSSTKEKIKSELFSKYMGFTKLFKLLCDLKKPLVGHNPFLDLMIMYKQFNEPLPNSYNIFKKKINALFPFVFDTKHISYILRELLNREMIWESNDLVKLYAYFNTGSGSFIAGYSPDVVPINFSPERAANQAHEAGWDSFYTGFCFIRMMHYFAVQANARCGMGPRPLTSKQHLHCVGKFRNCVNIPRANISHICLDGPDPRSDKPHWLVVESVDSERINVEGVINYLASVGNADVKSLSETQILIASNTHQALRDINNKFHRSNYRTQMYSDMKRSARIHNIMWSGLVMSGVGCSLLFWFKMSGRLGKF